MGEIRDAVMERIEEERERQASILKGLNQSFPCSYCVKDRVGPSAVRSACTGACGNNHSKGRAVTREEAPDVYAIPRQSKLRSQVGGSHYKDMAIQPLEYILANNIPFSEGAIIKYVSRWRMKNGVEDLKKAKQTIEVLIEYEEQKASRIGV